LGMMFMEGAYAGVRGDAMRCPGRRCGYAVNSLFIWSYKKKTRLAFDGQPCLWTDLKFDPHCHADGEFDAFKLSFIEVKISRNKKNGDTVVQSCVAVHIQMLASLPTCHSSSSRGEDYPLNRLSRTIWCLAFRCLPKRVRLPYKTGFSR
jgi:hypothetical protein